MSDSPKPGKKPVRKTTAKKSPSKAPRKAAAASGKTRSAKPVKTAAKSPRSSKTAKSPRTEMKLRSDSDKDHTKHRVLPKRKGLGVAAKFSIFVALLLAVIIFGGQAVSLVLASDRVSNEIDNQGVLLCHTLLSGGRKLIGGLSVTTMESLDPDDEDAGKTLGDLLIDSTLENPHLQDVLHGILFVKKNAEGKDVALFGKPVSIGFRDEVVIHDVKRTTAKVDGIAVRRYNLVMPDNPDYRVEVYLKSARLDELRAAMTQTMILTAVISLVAGILGAVVLSGKVASPIGVLANDMLKVASGELGHKTRVSGRDEVGVLAQAFNMMSEDLEISHKIELEKIEQDRDLALAHDVQESLLPREIPTAQGYNIFPFYRSAKDVGGDYYDVVRIDKNRIALMVADVAGKGTQGAMIMAMTRGITRSFLTGAVSPALALSHVNRSLAQDLKPGSFVTAMCAILDQTTGELTVASAGHNAMVLVRYKKTSCEMINPPGIALGFDKGPLFNKVIKDQKVQLRVGDRVVLYTDGVVEAMSPEREEYGDKRFQSFCIANAGKRSDKFVHDLVGSLDEHKGSGPQHDDITIVTLRKIK